MSAILSSGGILSLRDEMASVSANLFTTQYRTCGSRECACRYCFVTKTADVLVAPRKTARCETGRLFLSCAFEKNFTGHYEDDFIFAIPAHSSRCHGAEMCI